MTSFGRSRSALLMMVLVPVVINCAPDRARQLREEKSLTLGLPLGVTYRPNGKVGLGLTGGTGQTANKIDSVGDNGDPVSMGSSVSTSTSTTPKDGERVVKEHYTEISPFVQYFPWDTSAFFVGAGGTYKKTASNFQENTADSTTLEPSYTPVSMESKSIYFNVPVGWAWIWTPGFSLTLDATASIPVSHSNTYDNDGTTGKVNETNRNKTVDAIEKNQTSISMALGGMIGWSF